MNVNGMTSLPGAAALQFSKQQSQAPKKAPGKTDGPKVSLTSLDSFKSLRLVADKAMQKILEMTRLAAQELGYDPGTMDTSPEATSSRIANFAIGLFGLYRKQNPDMDDETALNEYQKLINGAVNNGYQEALAVLSALGVEDEGIFETARKTIEMTFEKLNSWFDSQRAALE